MYLLIGPSNEVLLPLYSGDSTPSTMEVSGLASQGPSPFLNHGQLEEGREGGREGEYN